MVVYTTLLGFTAGLAMLLMANVLKLYHESADGPVRLPVYGAMLLAVGVPLTVLGFLMTVAWPLNVSPALNIAFGEPTLMLGVLALTAAAALLRGFQRPLELVPVKLVLGALGLILLAISSAIFSYELFGDSPPLEPIVGRFTGWSDIVWGLAYGIAGIGCVAAYFYRLGATTVYHIVRWTWIVTGAFFLLYSVLNYRTHIGFQINLERGTNFRW